MSAIAAELSDWLPIRVHRRDGLVVDWCWMGEFGFADSFFVDTVERALARPYSLLFRRETPIEALEELEPGLSPSGFIFHVSRCGSTLLSRMLAAVPEHIVLSEPLPVDDILRDEAPEVDRARWLRAVVSTLGRRRRGDERAYVLKFDAWAVLSLDIVRRAFPDVPCLFVIRDPVEVLASHLRGRGAHMVPGALDPRLFGVEPDSLPQLTEEEYYARVLESIYGAALHQRDHRSLYLDYSALPAAVFDRVLPAFGMAATAAERELMSDETAFHAKHPDRLFAEDRLARVAEVPTRFRTAVEERVGPLYAELLRLC